MKSRSHTSHSRIWGTASRALPEVLRAIFDIVIGFTPWLRLLDFVRIWWPSGIDWHCRESQHATSIRPNSRVLRVALAVIVTIATTSIAHAQAPWTWNLT